MKKTIKKISNTLGPGLVTGIADNDPSGIATYSQAGAQFGLNQLWVCFYTLPLQIAIQEVCARIGAATGKGLAANIRDNYSKTLLSILVGLILIANIINIGANIGAMAAATKLILPINLIALTILFTIAIILLEVFIRYKNYSKILKWLCIFVFIYPLTLFIIDGDWKAIIKSTFTPHLELNFQFLFILIGVLGTTISPYLFFWEASQVVEEEKKANLTRGKNKPKINKQFIIKTRIDNFVGMLFSQLCAWSIMVVAASTLHKENITDIKTAADAAKAIEPFVQVFPHAGYIAKIVFAFGIIGLGFLSIPVLAGSAAYAASELFQWNQGLNRKLTTAPGFYSVIIFACLIGLLINFIGIEPMKGLIYSAVINGVVAAPLILIVALIGKNKKIMGKYRSGLLSNLFVLLTFICMVLASIIMFLVLGKNH